MLHLAIECSGTAGSVAVFDGVRQLAYQALPDDASSVQRLAPTIDTSLKSLGIAAPGLISVTSGPGSFTGLRVGMATAKMLSMAWDCPIVGVDSLATISLRTSAEVCSAGQPAIIFAVMNAFRKQVFAAAWYRCPHDSADQACQAELKLLANSQILDATTWMDSGGESLQLEPQTAWPAAPSFVSGPGLRQYPWAQATAPFPHVTPGNYPGNTIVPSEYWHPRAIEVAKLGWAAYRDGQSLTADRLTANYIRASAAEEKATPAKTEAKLK